MINPFKKGFFFKNFFFSYSQSPRQFMSEQISKQNTYLHTISHPPITIVAAWLFNDFFTGISLMFRHARFRAEYERLRELLHLIVAIILLIMHYVPSDSLFVNAAVMLIYFF